MCPLPALVYIYYWTYFYIYYWTYIIQICSWSSYTLCLHFSISSLMMIDSRNTRISKITSLFCQGWNHYNLFRLLDDEGILNNFYCYMLLIHLFKYWKFNVSARRGLSPFLCIFTVLFPPLFLNVSCFHPVVQIQYLLMGLRYTRRTLLSSRMEVKLFQALIEKVRISLIFVLDH